MRVGLIATSYPRFDGDPAGGFVAGHAAALRALGHDVDVLAAGDGDGRVRGGSLFYTGGAPDALEAGGARVLASAASFSARLYAAAALRVRRWDAIVAHWLAPSAVVAAALPTRAPLLAIAHGGDVFTLRRAGLLAPTLRALLLRGARIAFVSAALRDLALASVDDRVRARLADCSFVQPMGIDAARFAALPRAPESPPIIAVVARLVPIKGVDVAIDALALARRRTGAHLVIAGDGPLRVELAARARSLDLDVTFTGAVPTHARDELLARASLVIVPSRPLVTAARAEGTPTIAPSRVARTEGTPTIALEALAAGVPVVATRTGGLAELPSPPVVVVPPDDPRALATAIADTLAMPPRADVLRAAIRDLDWAVVATRLAPPLRDA
jgi:glycosyltransferase involved in cell wall biosynthesis|nr:glycosyltransferase family 4 protein [Kofleriaceae bacterium]